MLLDGGSRPYPGPAPLRPKAMRIVTFRQGPHSGGNLDTRRGPRGPYQRGIDRRAQILDNAIAVFGARGYSGSTLRQVADLTGITPGAIRVHFASKEGLLIEVLRFWDENQLSNIEPTDLAAYFGSLKRLMAYHINHRGLLQLYLRLAAEASEPAHPAHEFIQSRYRRTLDSIAGRLRAASAAGEIHELTDPLIRQEARTVLAVIEGLERQWILNPATDLVGLVGSYLDSTLARLDGGSRASVDEL